MSVTPPERSGGVWAELGLRMDRETLPAASLESPGVSGIGSTISSDPVLQNTSDALFLFRISCQGTRVDSRHTVT